MAEDDMSQASMRTIITFIIPVRHQDNAKDWPRLKANLVQTLASISAQTHPGWRAVIVCNEGADLPPLPDRCEALRVDLPPNNLHDLASGDREAVLDAFRADKGRRVLKGMLHARDTQFYMIVDDDDFVSHNIVDFASRHPNANGWKILDGYIWGDGGNLLYLHNKFSDHCGTSLIVNSASYALPESFEAADLTYIKDYLGSHVRPQKLFAEKGKPLAPLPFRGAVYRVGHPGSHSVSPPLVTLYLLNRYNYLRPHVMLRNLFSFRRLNTAMVNEFFGGVAPA